MLFFTLGVAIALFILRMGVWLGRAQAEQEFNFMREEMGLNSAQDEWDKLFSEESDHQ